MNDIPTPNAQSNFWDNLDNAMNNVYKNYQYYIDLERKQKVTATLTNKNTPAGFIYSIGEALKPYTFIIIIATIVIFYKR